MRAAILLSLVATVACTGRGSERLRAISRGTDLPSLTGDWDMYTTLSTSTCPATPVPPVPLLTGGIFAIQVSGADFTYQDVCTCPASVVCGYGTMAGAAIVFQRQRVYVIDSGCSLDTVEEYAGSLHGDGFSGDVTVKATAVGVCGPGFPCEIHGTFSAFKRCPTPGCSSMPMCPVCAC